MSVVEGNVSDVDFWLSKIGNEFRDKIRKRLNHRGMMDLLEPGEELEFTLEIKVAKRQPAQAKDLTERHIQN